MFKSALLAVLIGGLSAPAIAALVLDQEHVVSSGSSISGNSSTVTGFRRAQTVTAGMTGTLAQVHVQLFPGSFQGVPYSDAFVNNVTGINILATLNGVPQISQDAILSTGTFLELTDDKWAVFSTSFAITEGLVFAIEPVTSIAVNAWRTGGTYAGGSDYFVSGGSFVQPISPRSNGFRTFIDDSPVGGGGGGVVPEPASWAMLISGFGRVGAAMRRRRRALA
jgi:hypothetical protein